MIDYWIAKYGLEYAAETYYKGPKDATYKVLLAQYKAAESALTSYMEKMEAATKGDDK